MRFLKYSCDCNPRSLGRHIDKTSSTLNLFDGNVTICPLATSQSDSTARKQHEFLRRQKFEIEGAPALWAGVNLRPYPSVFHVSHHFCASSEFNNVVRGRQYAGCGHCLRE